ncbi:hypothetical protein [Pedobacter sp. SYP-B3415]|uniref:hypothetical protein n=1 Tax=Pedobacter sp. SYP-B3415 TaxID=2496641 RepID=UPI00101D53DF|nr:hypothetical protein [Pedobacter sp. SYP-B3415]
MKIALYVVVAIVAICLINFWYDMYISGRYYEHAGLFMTVLLGLFPVLVILAAYKLCLIIKNLYK